VFAGAGWVAVVGFAVPASGWSGTAGAALDPVTGAGAAAGGGLPNVSSRTDFGT
jgi:hypothetical protein